MAENSTPNAVGLSRVRLLSPKVVLRALKGFFENWRLPVDQRTPVQEQTQVGRRASTFTSQTRGRPVRQRRPRRFPPTALAVLPTMTAALLRTGPTYPMRLRREDLRIWVRQGKAPLSIVLIADVSASTAWFLGSVQKLLSVLYRDAYRSRDSMGLVAIQEDRVRVLHHPTRNLKSVLGSLSDLSPSGLTPLGEALERSLDLMRHQHRRDGTTNPLAILLSDCHPEPVTRTGGSLQSSPEYAHVARVAARFRRERVPIIVVNPSHMSDRKKGFGPGTELGMRIAAASGGKYYGVPTSRVRTNMDRHAPKIQEMLVSFRCRSLDPILPDVTARP
jgi:Mg-chelatase subunit ChlD